MGKLHDFIKENTEKALLIDLENCGALPCQILLKQKLKPNKEFIENAINELENRLVNCLAKNNHIADKSKTPGYLQDIRLYLEYSSLLPSRPIVKQKPELNKALISFSSNEIIESLHNELKGYFQGKEAELKRALQGKQLQEFLLFPHNQNKFVEVFKRLKYNGFLLSTPKETKDWICATFTYQYQKGNKKEVRKFNTSTVHDILTKDKGEPTKKERICNVDWLPYKSHLTRQREAEKESI